MGLYEIFLIMGDCSESPMDAGPYHVSYCYDRQEADEVVATMNEASTRWFARAEEWRNRWAPEDQPRISIPQEGWEAMWTIQEQAKAEVEDPNWDFHQLTVYSVDVVKRAGYKPYNTEFGDDKLCECEHTYYRHFDSYADMEPVGCKYCPCRKFKEGSQT